MCEKEIDITEAENCTLCPRMCGADRAHGERGFCGADHRLKAARAALHMWEEPPISGTRGSGTVFFSCCPLKCVYCQNREISADGDGLEIDIGRLTDIFFELRNKGAHNINLVSPTQYADKICAAIEAAKARGFDLPFVWNTGGYERVETLKALEGLIDIYLTDFKYMSPELAKMYSGAPDYPAVACDALCEMLRQQPTCIYDGALLRRGVIVRHLVLPGCANDSKEILRYLNNMCGEDAIVSVMSQYTPRMENDLPPQLACTLDAAEYEEVVEYAESIGIVNAFIQDGKSASESFIPKFDYIGVLPSDKNNGDSNGKR